MNDKFFITEFDVPIDMPHAVLLEHHFLQWDAVRTNGLVDEITKSLRYCKRAMVFLVERIVPYTVIKELEWLNIQGCDIKMIVNDKKLADSYSMSCSNIIIDTKIDSNLIIIWGQNDTEAFILGDTIHRVAQSKALANLVEGKNCELSEKFTSEMFIGSNTIYYVDSNLANTLEWKLIAEQAPQVDLFIIGSKASYNPGVYDYFRNKSFKLLITEATLTTGTWIWKSGKLYRVFIILGRILFLEADLNEVKTLVNMSCYTPVYFEKALVKFESDQVYWIIQNRIEKNNLKNVKLIKRTIFTDSIDDYVLNKYDKAFMNDYISYQEYRKVRYEITLVPPLLIRTDKVSSKYSSLVEYLKENSKYISEQIKSVDEACKLYLSVQSTKNYVSEWFSEASSLVSHFDIQDGRNIKVDLLYRIEKLVKSSIDSRSRIEDSFSLAISTLIKKSYGKKTTKFDNELNQLRMKVIQLGSQICEDNELRIKRKISDIEKEIETLDKIKKSVTPQTVDSGKEDLDNIMLRYSQFAKLGYKIICLNIVEDLSIAKVIINPEDKLSKAEKALQEVVAVLVDCQNKLIDLWDKIEKLELPKVGILYSNRDGNVLAIKRIEDVNRAKEEALKYSALITVDRLN